MTPLQTFAMIAMSYHLDKLNRGERIYMPKQYHWGGEKVE